MAGSAFYSYTIASNFYLLPAGSALPRHKGDIGPTWLMRATTKPGQKAIWYVCKIGWVLELNVYVDIWEAN